MTLPRGFLTNCDKIAVRVRASMGLEDHAPIKPIDVCNHYDIILERLSEQNFISDVKFAPVRNPSQIFYSGHTCSIGARRLIVYNDYHSTYRQNSNICHELAHCFLNHENTQLRSETGDRSHVRQVEEEATTLSGYLLMTNAACWHVVSNAMQQTAQTIYGVSPEMLKLRLGKSGALKRLEYANKKRFG